EDRVVSKSEPVPEAPASVALLYPMYLDTDMCMAFAAALGGGVALEMESVEHAEATSSAVRNLRGNLRLFDVLGAGGDRSVTDSDAATSEARMTRRHTEASIFIALYDELRRRRLIDEAILPGVKPGDLVAMELGPAMAPLRRVLEQLSRLFELANPSDAGYGHGTSTKPQRQHGAGSARKSAAMNPAGQPEFDAHEVQRLFTAMKADLDHSGMTDVVVRREGDLSVVLTLDNRFVTTQSLELLHTSAFTVVGKVTQVWPTEDDIAKLYRRSVLALMPALSQAMAWNIMAALGALATAVDVGAAQRGASEAIGVALDQVDDESTEIRFGDDFQALLPVLTGPAIQILPLAVCA
ncbi:MAG TPA: hypothetical protein VIG47_12595, partial [Gemmatimonadaceae bacterium]